MNKLQHLQTTKKFLLQVVKYRKSLLKQSKGKPLTESMRESLVSIPYNVANIDSFDRIMVYIEREEIQRKVLDLIPSNKPAWKSWFEHLIIEGKILQGKLARQYELEF